MAARGFDFGDFLWRWLFAIGLVLATFNPTGHSYVEWALRGSAATSVKVLVGVILLILYVIYVRATVRAIGWLGIMLVAALVGGIVWVLVDFGWLGLGSGTGVTWILLLGVATILGVGLSWSHIRRGLTGQVDVDDVSEG